MNNLVSRFDGLYYTLGRSLLGIYFLLPGLMKIADYADTLDYMLSKNVPLAELLLPVTIVIQVGLGVALIIGKMQRVSALVLFGLTVLINFYMHNFWALQGDPSYAHELQNFVKNLGIAAGLLVLAGSAKRN